jgi:hypothetical protein
MHSVLDSPASISTSRGATRLRMSSVATSQARQNNMCSAPSASCMEATPWEATSCMHMQSLHAVLHHRTWCKAEKADCLIFMGCERVYAPSHWRRETEAVVQRGRGQHVQSQDGHTQQRQHRALRHEAVIRTVVRDVAGRGGSCRCTSYEYNFMIYDTGSTSGAFEGSR